MRGILHVGINSEEGYQAPLAKRRKVSGRTSPVPCRADSPVDSPRAPAGVAHVLGGGGEVRAVGGSPPRGSRGAGDAGTSERDDECIGDMSSLGGSIAQPDGQPADTRPGGGTGPTVLTAAAPWNHRITSRRRLRGKQAASSSATSLAPASSAYLGAGNGGRRADFGGAHGGDSIAPNSVHGAARGGPSRFLVSSSTTDRSALPANRDGHNLAARRGAEIMAWAANGGRPPDVLD